MRLIDEMELKELMQKTRALLEKRFTGEELTLRLRIWNSLCKTKFLTNEALSLKDAAKQAFQTAKGMKVGKRTLAKIRISELEAHRKQLGQKASPFTGKAISELQRSLMKRRTRGV